jgi:phage shock protein C
MKTRTQQRPAYEQELSQESSHEDLHLESMSEEELEALLFKEDEAPRKDSMFNLPTLAGLSMIMVGVAYLFQKLGFLPGLALDALVGMLPWLAGILIILLGFGVLSWKPKGKKPARTKAATTAKAGTLAGTPVGKKRLTKSLRDKKIAGVCAGIADYFGIDPTVIRIAFVLGMFASGSTIFAYIILSMVMPDGDGTPPRGDRLSMEERIRIIRDS